MVKLLIQAAAAAISVFMTVSALAASGDLIWRFETRGAIWGDVALQGETAYFGSDDGHMYALKVKEKTLVWRYKTGGFVRSKAAFHGPRVYFTSDDGFLYALQKHTGQLLWKFDLGDGALTRNLPSNDPPGDFDWGKSSPVVRGKHLYVGSATGSVYALDTRNGSVLWRFQATDRVRGAPTVAGNLVYISSWDKHVYALRRDSGHLQWKQAVGDRIVSTPAVIDGRLIVGARDAMLHAWQAKTGEYAWTYTHKDGSWVESSAVAGDGKTFFIGSSDGRKLSKFSSATGAEIWSFATTGWTWGTPVVANGRVYVGSTGTTQAWQPLKGGFFAIDARTGKELWRYEDFPTTGYVDGGVNSAPAVAFGRVLVGAVDGNLYVFEE